MIQSKLSLSPNLLTNIAVLEDIHLDIALLSPLGAPGILDYPVKLLSVSHQKDRVVYFRIAWALDNSVGIVLPSWPSASTNTNCNWCSSHGSPEGSATSKSGDPFYFIVSLVVFAPVFLGLVGIGALRNKAIGGSILHWLALVPSIASLVSEITCAIDDLLLGQIGHPVSSLDHDGWLNSCNSCKSIAGATFALIFDRADGSSSSSPVPA